ncbi:MAG TPA: PAS domain-containing sensor histidine kinase, partial [Nitrospira sp.]|nr:PAS domain-containing sensor histidine kinase [Nitrospira sp.]
YDGNGRLVHFLTYIRDISDRKQVEDVLRLSQARWRSVIETLPIGIAITTVDGKVLDINTAAWRMLGYESKEEVFQAGSGSHFLDSTDQRCRIEKIRMGDRVSEAQYTKKNGTLFWGRCTAAIFSEQDGEVLVINAYEDITEQRKHHETLQHAKEDLQAANQRLMERDHVRTKFVSVVSHELRTPMAAIKGFIDNMLSGVTGSLSERQCDYLQRMQTSLDRLTRLIAQLLDWSGLEMGRSPLLPKPVSPAVLVQAVADNARAVAEPKHIQVTTRIEEPLPVILADSDKVEQILWNLVGNAIKFSRQGGIVTIGCEAASDGGVLFKVTDAGCGIPKEDIPKVFDQFSGVHAPVPGVKGAQLGLYITRSLVLLHGGRIWVESTVGQGSRFFVHLPRNPPEPSCG